MSHNREEIIISSSTPLAPGADATADPEFTVTVAYHPAAGQTPAQIGNEVTRIQRRINQIIEGTPD